MENEDIQGLYYIPHYLTNEEIKMLKDNFVNKYHFEPITNYPYSRKVAHFGYFYSYDHSGLKKAEEVQMN
jgi:hypothetical protein